MDGVIQYAMAAGRRLKK